MRAAVDAHTSSLDVGPGRSAHVHRIEANPTYQVVAGAVGLLVFLNVVNHLILFAAALTAISTTGQVTDLAAPRSGTAPTATTSGPGP